MTMAVIWLLCIHRLLHLLRTRHPETYDALGRPSFLNYSIKSQVLPLRFLFGKQYRRIEDPKLIVFCDFLNVYFLAYLLVFTALLFAPR